MTCGVRSWCGRSRCTSMHSRFWGGCGKRRNMRQLRGGVWLLICTLLATPAWAEDFRGRKVSEVLDELRSAGLTLIYKTQIGPSELRIETEPHARSGTELAREILAAHGLALSQVAPSVFAVVASQAPNPAPDSATSPEPAVEEVLVTTRRYRLAPG